MNILVCFIHLFLCKLRGSVRSVGNKTALPNLVCLGIQRRTLAAREAASAAAKYTLLSIKLSQYLLYDSRQEFIQPRLEIDLKRPRSFL